MEGSDLVILVGLCLAIVLSLVTIMFPPSMQKMSDDYSDLAIDIGGVFFFILCVYLITLPGTLDFKRISVCLLLFISLYMSGDIISSIYRDFLGGSPDLSIADILWLVGYIPLIFISYYTVWKNSEHLKMKTLFVVFIVWVLVLIAVVMPAIVVSFVDSSNFVQTVILSLSPILDMILILALILVLLIYREGFVLRYWIFITAGVVTYVMGDMVYLLSPSTDNFYLNALPNIFYTLGYPIMALGVFSMITMREKFQNIEPTGRYVISQVFVAHKKGTLMAHVMTKESKRCVDPDVMVGMLTAIQDFVKESFEGEKHQKLDELKYGDLRLVFRRGNDFMLVAVISGQMTNTIEVALEQALDQIQMTFGVTIHDWDGTAADIAGIKDIVAKLLTQD